MALNIDAKFEKKKLNFVSKNNMRNLTNFHQSTRKSQNWEFDRILYPKQKMYQLKTYKGVLYHDNEE